MRPALRLVLGLMMNLVLSALAPQSPAQGPRSLFATTRPEATVVVRKHATGADLAEVTVSRPDYPPDALRQACERLGVITGIPVRGLAITTGGGFLKATFATGGLLTDARPHFRIAPIVRAFGFGPVPLRALAILYDGETADASTVKTFRLPERSFRVEAQRLPSVTGAAGGVEYRTLIGDVKESEIVEPGPATKIAPVTPPPPPRDLTLPILLGVGALAAGTLVYTLVLRPRGGGGGGTIRADRG